MKGLRFYPDSLEVDTDGDSPIFIHGSIEESRSDFDYIFRPVYPALSPFLYADERGASSIGADPEVLDDYLRQSAGSLRDWIIMPTRLLDQFGKYVSDDWNLLVLFEDGTEHDTIGDVTDQLLNAKPAAFPACPQAHVCLHNWDGIYWEVFAKDFAILEQLRTAHSGDSRLAMYWVNYEDDYPNPRNTPLEEA